MGMVEIMRKHTHHHTHTTRADYEDKRYITGLATGFLFPNLIEVFKVAEKDAVIALELFLLFVEAHPRTVRERVQYVIEESEDVASELARKEIEKRYGRDWNTLWHDVERGLLSHVRAEYIRLKYLNMLRRGLRALADEWERHGIIWFGRGPLSI